MQGLLWLDDIDRPHASIVGRKAAHLAELSRIHGVRVPPGFCITTDAFRDDTARPVSDDLANEIAAAVARLGLDAGYAIRSSATAEDLPGASFAGQYDTFLNV